MLIWLEQFVQNHQWIFLHNFPSYLLVGIISRLFHAVRAPQFLKTSKKSWKTQKINQEEQHAFTRLLLFVVIIFSAAVFLWPLFLSSCLGKKTHYVDRVQESRWQGYRQWLSVELVSSLVALQRQKQRWEHYGDIHQGWRGISRGSGTARRAYSGTVSQQHSFGFFWNCMRWWATSLCNSTFQHEVEKYLVEGLRPDYRQELSLIDFNVWLKLRLKTQWHRSPIGFRPQETSAFAGVKLKF